MKPELLYLCFLLILIPAVAFCQESRNTTLIASVFTNAPAMPFSGKAGIIHTPIHPGLSLGTVIPLNKNEKNQLIQTIRLGYFYQRFGQEGIQLYTESGYRRQSKSGFAAEARIGLGYFHSFPDFDLFVLKDGVYRKKTNWGRPQLMAAFTIGPSYDFEQKGIAPVRIFLDYQVWFQTPFVTGYVPILPNISLHIGAAFKI